MTRNYSSFVLLATAPSAVPTHTAPDRFGGWSLINSPIFTLLCPPCPQSPGPPAQSLVRGSQAQAGSAQSSQGGEGALGVAHGQQAAHSDSTEVLGCPGRLRAAGRRGAGVPCTWQGTCRATSQSGSCRAAPRVHCQGKASHSKSTPYLTHRSYQQEEPAQQLPISGCSPRTYISPRYFLDIHSCEQGDSHEMLGKLLVLLLCLSALRECEAAVGHHSPL